MLSAMTPAIAIRCRAASRSAVSPQQIATLIREGVRRIELGKQLVEQSRQALEEIGAVVSRVTHTTAQIGRTGRAGLKSQGPMRRRISPEFATSCAATQRGARRQPRRKRTRAPVPRNPLSTLRLISLELLPYYLVRAGGADHDFWGIGVE